MTSVAVRRWSALVLLTVGAGLALARAGGGDEPAWTVLSVADGLPHDAVESVATSGGAVWAGTSAGLTRLDGRGEGGARALDLPTDHLPDALGVDDDGDVWVASLDGLVSGDGERWRRHASADGLPEGPVHDVVPDGERVWAATPHGVYRLEDERWRRLPESPHSVGSLAVADDGTVWAAVDTVSSGEALFEFDGDRWTTHVTREHPDKGPETDTEGLLPGRVVRAVDIDDDGVVWAGTDGGVAAFDGDDWTHHTEGDGLPHGGVLALRVGPDGEVWAATVEEGIPDPDHAVAHFDGDDWAAYTTDDGLPDAWVNDLIVSADDTVWAATDEGLARLLDDRR